MIKQLFLKLILATIFMGFFFPVNSQDFTINELIDLKSGDIELFKKKYVGKGWSAPRRKLFQRKRQSNIKGPEEPDGILHYFPSNTKGFDSFVNISYFKDKKIPERINWTFKSKKSFEKLMNSMKSVKFDKEWTDTFNLGGRTIRHHFKKNDIYLRVWDTEINLLNPYLPRFGIDLSDIYPYYTYIMSTTELLELKSEKFSYFMPFIYYKELKIGGEVREFDSDFINEKIPRDREYYLSTHLGDETQISVVVVNGLIVKINKREL